MAGVPTPRSVRIFPPGGRAPRLGTGNGVVLALPTAGGGAGLVCEACCVGACGGAGDGDAPDALSACCFCVESASLGPLPGAVGATT